MKHSGDEAPDAVGECKPLDERTPPSALDLRYQTAICIVARAAIRVALSKAARPEQPPAGDGRTDGKADTPDPTDCTPQPVGPSPADGDSSERE